MVLLILIIDDNERRGLSEIHFRGLPATQRLVHLAVCQHPHSRMDNRNFTLHGGAVLDQFRTQEVLESRVDVGARRALFLG